MIDQPMATELVSGGAAAAAAEHEHRGGASTSSSASSTPTPPHMQPPAIIGSSFLDEPSTSSSSSSPFLAGPKSLKHQPGRDQLAECLSAGKREQQQRQQQQQRSRYIPSATARAAHPHRATALSAAGSSNLRSNRRSPMACREDIPKYSFGTSHLVDYEVGESASDVGGPPLPPPPKHRLHNHHQSQGQEPRISAADFKQLVMHAIRKGCRHFDCAPLYGTQPLVGQCLQEVSKQVPRQHFFVTSKLPPNMMQEENIYRSIRKSIEELQCCYLDLFLIHAPFSTKHLTDDDFYPKDEQGNLQMDESEQLLENAWRKLAELKSRGYTRYIGVSNVNMEQLIRLQAIHPIDVVQNEYHIYNQNRDLFDYCEEIDVHFEAYACFGNPAKCKRESLPCCMSDRTVRRVAARNSLTVPQTIIQWIHHQPLSYVIRCDTKRQLDENLEAIELAELPVEDLIELDSLDRKCRVHTFAEHKGLTNHREYPFRDLIEFVNPIEQQQQQQPQQQHDREPNNNNINNNRPTTDNHDLHLWQQEGRTKSCNNKTNSSSSNNDEVEASSENESSDELVSSSTTTSVVDLAEARSDSFEMANTIGRCQTSRGPTPDQTIPIPDSTQSTGHCVTDELLEGEHQTRG